MSEAQLTLSRDEHHSFPLAATKEGIFMVMSYEPEAETAIGWSGLSVKQMLTESERLLSETDHYYGIDTLTLKEEDPIRYEKIFSRLRGGLVNARETALNISASPIVREIGELC